MRKPIVVLGLLAVLLAACTSGGGGTGQGKNGDTQQSGPTAVAPSGAPEPTAVPGSTPESSSGPGFFESILSPFSIMSGTMLSGGASLGLPPASGEGDPSLKAALLTLDDLPSGYVAMMPGGESFSFETDQGSISMATSVFAQPKAAGGFSPSMVMSAAVLPSGDLLQQTRDEFQRYSDPAELERKIQEWLGSGENFFKELQVLDASGLGDGGLGLHMVASIDVSRLVEQSGASLPPGAGFLKDGLASDIYVFVRGDHLLMVMSLWPGNGPAPIDSRALAEVLDKRAGSAF